ncbi:MAG: hypothetical protein AB7O21_07760 [Gammaproteobacteria bacterium]
MTATSRTLPPVRALARRYAEGRLERRTYIVERRRLIDDIVAGRVDPLRPVTPPAVPPAPCTLGEADATLELPRALTAT